MKHLKTAGGAASLRPAATGSALAVACALVLSASCSVPFDRIEVAVLMPVAPAVWTAAWGEPRFHVRWQSAVDSGTAARSVEAGTTVVTTIPRVAPVALLADVAWETGGPALACGERLAPAGGVWPTQSTDPSARRGGSIALSFESGPAASLIADVLAAGVDIRGLLVSRLIDEIAAALPSDPWLIDYLPLRTAIAARSMRTTLIRAAPTWPVDIAVPDGSWVAMSPFARAVAGGDPWPAAPVGVTALWSSDGRRVALSVDSDGRAWATLPR